MDRVILVLGHQAELILARINTERTDVVINKEYASGLSSSLRAGLGAIGPDASAVLLVLADQPFLSVSTINRMIEAHKITGRPIVVPLLKKVQGNPVLFDQSLFGEIARISGDVGAKQVIQKHAKAVLGLKLNDPTQFIDVDTRQDLEKVRSVRKRKTTTQTCLRNQATDAPRLGRPF